MTVTVAELARRLGVSPSTVSRALNDHPRISEKTKARVYQALRELQRSERSTSDPVVIGLFLTEVAANPFFSRVIAGVEELAQQIGAYVALEKLRGDGHPLPYSFVRRRVDCAIVGGALISDETIARFTATDMPVVFIGRYLNQESMKKTYAVISDNVAGGTMAAEHLLNKGYDDLIVVQPPLLSNNYRDRLVGYAKVATRHGMQVKSITCAISRPNLAPVVELIKQRVTAGYRVGVFVMSDHLAVLLTKALVKIGLRPPEKVGIIGYDGLALSCQADPPLSTIDVAKEALGFYAARLVTDILHGRVDRPIQVNVQPRLVERASTASKEQSSSRP